MCLYFIVKMLMLLTLFLFKNSTQFLLYVVFVFSSLWDLRYPFICTYHDDVIRRKHFPRDWHFVRGIHRLSMDFPHKGQWRGALMFSSIARTNGWENNRVASDLRRHRAYYDVTLMYHWGLIHSRVIVGLFPVGYGHICPAAKYEKQNNHESYTYLGRWW